MIPTDRNKNDRAECFRFVLHERQAGSLQHLLRLENEKILKCWILPNGLPQKAKEKCIAVTAKDCKTEMLYFCGSQPRKNKIPAEVKIKDSGYFELLNWSDVKIEFILNGSENNGRYILVKFEKAGPGTWIIMKAD